MCSPASCAPLSLLTQNSQVASRSPSSAASLDLCSAAPAAAVAPVGFPRVPWRRRRVPLEHHEVHQHSTSRERNSRHQQQAQKAGKIHVNAPAIAAALR